MSSASLHMPAPPYIDCRVDGHGESAGLLREGGEWEIFGNSSNSDEFDEDQSEEIETRGN